MKIYSQRWKGKNIYLFVDDLPNGHMIVQCSECEDIFETQDILKDDKEQCTNCGRILDYPEGASW